VIVLNIFIFLQSAEIFAGSVVAPKYIITEKPFQLMHFEVWENVCVPKKGALKHYMATVVLFVSSIVLFLRVFKMIQEREKNVTRGWKIPRSANVVRTHLEKGSCKGLKEYQAPSKFVKGTCKGHKKIAADSCILAWQNPIERSQEGHLKFAFMKSSLGWICPFARRWTHWNGVEYCLLNSN